MNIENYIGWAANVNKVILDSSNISVGKSTKSGRTTESGGTRTFLPGFFIPDQYSVTMEFSWLPDEETKKDGETEYTRFLRWYKYIHRYGTVPFQFPSILYSPEAGIDAIDENRENYKTEYYRIISEVPGKKTGGKISVTMTWETVFFGVINIDTDNLRYTIVDAAASNGFVDVAFSQLELSEPAKDNFKLYIDYNPNQPNNSTEPIIGYNFDSNIARLYFKKRTDGKSHIATFSFTFNNEIIVKPNIITSDFIG